MARKTGTKRSLQEFRKEILNDMLKSCMMNLYPELDADDRLANEWELAVVQNWTKEPKGDGDGDPTKDALENRILILENNIKFWVLSSVTGTSGPGNGGVSKRPMTSSSVRGPSSRAS